MWTSLEVIVAQREKGVCSLKTIEAEDVVRCADTGFLFYVHMFLKTILGFAVEEGKGGELADH
eukprot:2933648-Pleurochrysis_carterae.AAC.1